MKIYFRKKNKILKKNEIIVPNDKKYNFIEKITSGSIEIFKKCFSREEKEMVFSQYSLNSI